MSHFTLFWIAVKTMAGLGALMSAKISSREE